MSVGESTRSRARLVACISLILIAGVVFQLFLWSRQSLREDQLAELRLGLALVEDGHLSPVGVASSGQGHVPGSLFQLLIGVPLQFWRDYRAPGLGLVLTHMLAVAVLIATIGRAMGIRLLMFYLAVYWLSPWRTYHSGFLWNPNYLVLPAALHLGSSYLLRSRKRFLPSAVLATSIVLALQLHASFIILGFASALMIWRKLIRLDWRGAVVGVALGSLTLIPTAIAFFRGTLPDIVPHRAADASAITMPILNAMKSLLYWFRFGSPEVGRRLGETVYLSGDAVDATPFLPIPSAIVAAVALAATVAVAVPVLAAAKFLRPSLLRGSRNRTGSAHTTDIAWTQAYALCFLLAMLATALLSPSIFQAWHVLISLHAACIPVALFLGFCADSRARWMRSIVILFLAVHVSVALLVGFGNRMYLNHVYLMEGQALREDVQRLLPHLDRAVRQEPTG
jgi:hypothetical protein